MEEDLRTRLLRGDLRALDDPALPLELLANPGLVDGLIPCAESLCLRLGFALIDRRREMRPVFDGWQQPAWRQLQLAADPSARSPLFRASYPIDSRHMVDKYRDRLARAIKAPAALPRAERAVALLDLARRLLALDPPRADRSRAALSKLESLLCVPASAPPEPGEPR